MKIIFFTKDRPMQYRAFLESFLYNTQIKPVSKDIDGFKNLPITTIISNTNGYEDIIEEFKDIVQFIDDQGKFFNDILRDIINSTYSNYILFGCDDQIYNRTINLKNASNYLDANPDVIGHSFRLGINIPYFPNKYECKDSIAKWHWRYNQGDFNVPFELMATVYPTWFCQSLLLSCQDNIKCPNFYESFGCNFCTRSELAASFMSCDDNTGATFAQDINRCQDYFTNKIQTTQDLSCPTLLKLYKEGYRIDWMSMQNKVHDNIFMGDRFWKLYKI